MSECPRCNDYGHLFDIVCGMVNCPVCAPNERVCANCGGSLEPFESNPCAWCRDEDGEDMEKIQVSPKTRIAGYRTLTWEQFCQASESELQADSCED
ncbi:hypothetical protein [Laspinema palackyanum]|uniref:hypothetical protein n=1 Tax=Laspinema palackyanum TaxID=3231601 RepID=UPI00345C88D4|nr:hypothetical protein [Laspinema sp. D2c]